MHSEPIPSPSQFNDPISFLRAVYEAKKERNRRFSLAQWSRHLGIRSPATLWRILERQRALGPDIGKQISERLELNQKDRAFFEFMLAADQMGASADALLKQIQDSEALESTDLSLDTFSLISEWYHLAILEMLALSDFTPTASWISTRLGGGVTPEQCVDSLLRLARLQIITRTGEKIVRCADYLRVVKNVSSEAIRNFHRSMIELSLRAIDDQTLDQRILNGTSIALRRSDMSKAAEVIAEAHRKIAALSKGSNADEVYHFSTQFFKLTQRFEEEKL